MPFKHQLILFWILLCFTSNIASAGKFDLQDRASLEYHSTSFSSLLTEVKTWISKCSDYVSEQDAIRALGNIFNKPIPPLLAEFILNGMSQEELEQLELLDLPFFKNPLDHYWSQHPYHFRLYTGKPIDEQIYHLSKKSFLYRVQIIKHSPFSVEKVALDLTLLKNIEKLKSLQVRGFNILLKGLNEIAKKPIPMESLRLADFNLDIENLNSLSVDFPHLVNLSISPTGGCRRDFIQTLNQLTSLQELDITVAPGHENALAELKNLTQLQSLHLRSSSFPISPSLPYDTKPLLKAEITQALARLPQLENLAISRFSLNIDSIKYLAENRTLRKIILKEIDLLDSESFQALSGIPHLESLQIDRSTLTSSSFSPFMPSNSLEKITLLYNKITDSNTLSTLFELPKLRSVKYHPGDSRFSFEFLKQIQGSLPQVSRLDLGVFRGIPIQPLEAQALVDKFPNLEKLALYLVHVSDQSAQILAKFQKMRKLTLHSTQLDSPSAKQLAQLPHLEHLSISKISEAGLLELTKSKTLTILRVHPENLNHDTIQAICQMPNLMELSMNLSRFSEEALITGFQDCKAPLHRIEMMDYESQNHIPSIVIPILKTIPTLKVLSVHKKNRLR